MILRNALALCAAVSVGACAVDPKDTAGFSSALANVLAVTNASAAMDQKLAEDFVKQTADLEFLSKSTKSCRDSSDPIVKAIGVAAPGSVQTREANAIKARFAELQLIKTYSDALLSFAKSEAQRSAYIDDFNAIAGAINSTPVSTPELVLVAKTAQILGTAFKAMDTNITNARLRAAAQKMHPTLVKMVGNLKRKFHLVNDQTQHYLNAWRSCAEMKFVYMRDRPAPSPASAVVDLHNSYDAYQTQLRAYLNSVPQIGDALDKIVEANQTIISTSGDELVTTAQELAATVNGVVNAYKSVKPLAQHIASAH